LQFVGQTDLPLGIGAIDGDADIGANINFELESDECMFDLTLNRVCQEL